MPLLLNNMTKRERAVAVVTIALGLAALGYTLVIEPVAGQWRRYDSELNAKIAAFKRNMLILDTSASLENDYEAIVRIAHSDKSEEEDVADMMSYIENVSRTNGCFIVNIKPVGAKNFGTHREILVDMTAEANIDQFAKFLYEIENPRNTLLKVRRVTLTAQSGKGTGVLKGTFLISKVLID